MDPHTDKLPALALPQPSVEQSSVGFDTVSSVGTHEALAPQQESPQPQPQLAPATVPLTTPQPAMSPLQQTIQQAQPTPSDSQVDSSATDSTTTDELDKEWINKAKVIVNQTKSDPYTESKALGKVKSEYMKIRYNKDIKLAEDTHR